MSAEHKRLLRLAAEEMDTINDKGMCHALVLAFKGIYATSFSISDYSECKGLLMRMYLDDSPHLDCAYWMGPHFTKKQQDHRVMALLFAAEAYDDMEGL